MLGLRMCICLPRYELRLAYQGMLGLGLMLVYFYYEFACRGRSLGLLTKVD
jgi:hypothetical protein